LTPSADIFTGPVGLGLVFFDFTIFWPDSQYTSRNPTPHDVVLGQVIDIPVIVSDWNAAHEITEISQLNKIGFPGGNCVNQWKSKSEVARIQALVCRPSIWFVSGAGCPSPRNRMRLQSAWPADLPAWKLSKTWIEPPLL